MPYYVYAIHTDHTSNRLYGNYDDFKDAEKMEKDMRAGRRAGDNYYVTMFYAETDSEAEEKAKSEKNKAALTKHPE